MSRTTPVSRTIVTSDGARPLEAIAAPGTTPAQTTFAGLGVPAPLVAVLAAGGKERPFPIQADTLADTLAGRDVLGRGKTGSGKTLAFCLPMAARLGTAGDRRNGSKRRAGRPRGLILAPTRELATQIDAVLSPLAAAHGLATTTIYGGVKQGRQVSALNSGVDIVVACPGRLEDLMQQGFLTLDAVEITVLDEADHMADLGFLPVVTRILDKTPRQGQRLLFSATLDNGVDKIVRRFLTDPVHHSVDEANSPVAAMTHHVFEVATGEEKDAVVKALASGTGKRLLFTRTKHHAKKLAKKLTAAGIPAVDLHGNLSQPRRDSNLAAFSSGAVRVLVATDVAARGVDIDAVDLVVHVDPPTEHKAYLHRSGRTARAGNTGDVVTICLPEQRRDLAALLRKAKITVTPTRVTAQAAAVANLVGEIAPFVEPPQTTGAAVGHGGGAGGARRGGSGKRGSDRGGSGSRGSGDGAGTSRGANARRKRAARNGRDRDLREGPAGRPRARQSGRPASATTGRSASPSRRTASAAGSRGR